MWLNCILKLQTPTDSLVHSKFTPICLMIFQLNKKSFGIGTTLQTFEMPSNRSNDTVNYFITCDSGGTGTNGTTSIANDVSAQTEANQVHVVPVATSGADEPIQEIAQELANARNSINS